MKVKCPDCGTTGKINDSIIPIGGRNIKCPQCSISFFVENSAAEGVSTGDNNTQDLGNENPVKSLFDDDSSMASSGSDNFVYNINFLGKGKDLFILYLINYIKTVFTLGIYYFWGKVKVLDYLASTLELDSDRFSFDGRGKDLFKGWLIGMTLIIVLAIALQFLMAVSIYFIALFYVLLFAIIPFAIISTLRYRFAKTSWRSIFFSFRGEYKEYLKIYLKFIFLIVPTLYFYIPFWHCNSQKFFRSNTYFGNLNFDYTGDGKEVLKTMFVKAWFLIPLTFGIYYFWYKASLIRYDWEHTTCGNLKFTSTITGKKLFILTITNMLLLLVTFGLGFAWVKTRTLQHKFSWIQIEGNVDLNQIVQEMKDGGQTGEGIADMLDFDVGMILSW